MTQKETALDYAAQQFIGFMEGIRTGCVIALVEAMGLTADEWQRLKDGGYCPSLPDRYILQVDGYFYLENLES